MRLYYLAPMEFSNGVKVRTFMAFKKFNDSPRGDFPPREMVKGNWQCADCGVEITELPFEPAADRPIYCRDCWRKRREQTRGQRFER